MDASTILQVLVSPLLGTVFDNLSSLIQSEFGLVWGVNEELEKLTNTLSTIRDVLEDAEGKQLKDKPILNWLRKLKDVAYDAEDILDEFATEASLRPELEVFETNKGCNHIQVLITDSVLSCFHFKQILFRRTIAKRIKELREKFDEISQESFKFQLINLTTGVVQSGGEQQQRQTSSYLAEPEVYGREVEKDTIVNLLLNKTGVDTNDGPQGGDVAVYAIVGMGGLGKTTLAQLVHHDERIVKHFELRCWVCVSENFEPKTLFKAIIESSGRIQHDLQNLDTLQCLLQDRLRGKRFLLVLDDVWNEDQTKWETLKSSLKYGWEGSSIIVTTRLRTVASLMATLPVCHLKVLSEKYCWSLFKNRAFDVGKEAIPPNLKAIGKDIVKKCGGIPLAAKSLGSLLRFKRLENEWVYVRDSEILDLAQDTKDAILPALKLSYNHLPSNLRQCFAYCSIFPKDYKINKEELIYLWMANGFVKPKGRMELEDIGNEIFNDLSWRSFFQDFEKDKDENILWCKMHDLVHDLACSIMRDECLVFEVGKESIVSRRSTSTRHLSLVYEYSSLSSLTIPESSFTRTSQHMRTLLQLPINQSPPLELVYKNLKCLRALDLSCSEINAMPTSIGNLKHLRYLNLSKTYITSLPNESFCSLINLQILILNGCNRLAVLPKDIRKISSLRHLDIRGCNALTRMPNGIGKLTCLQTLSFFIVGADSECGIAELQGLDHLRGKLEITGLENVRSSSNATNCHLITKKNLHSLRLCWLEYSRMRLDNSTEEQEQLTMVGEDLQPHPNIKRLLIEGYGGVKLPSWMGAFSCLPNLVELSLENCKRCDHLPSLGDLPLLKILKIRGMESVKHIDHEFYHGYNHHQVSSFPSLEELCIADLPNLKEFSSWSRSSNKEKIKGGEEVNALVFPCLKTLTISKCPWLVRCILLPASLKHLELTECHEMVLSRSLESLLPCLSTLFIRGFYESISFPERIMLRNLTSLTIWSCPELKTLPKELMESLTALEELMILDCDELGCFSEGMQNLTSLSFFDIQCCRGLRSLQAGLRNLTTLKMLSIDRCPELEFLPDDFQSLISLRDLSLLELPKMTALPIVGLEHLTPTLEHLKISKCSGLEALPEWIVNITSLQDLKISDCENLNLLPEGLQQVTSLQILEIRTCHPDLHRRCEKETGDDWHKIAHIPHLINQLQP